MTGPLIYHGSAAASLAELQPLSRLHNSERKVVYLSSSIPYVLLYIWDSEKTQSSRKWVTGWLTDLIATVIVRESLLDQDCEHAHFMKRYFVNAWKKAKEQAE